MGLFRKKQPELKLYNYHADLVCKTCDETYANPLCTMEYAQDPKHPNLRFINHRQALTMAKRHLREFETTPSDPPHREFFFRIPASIATPEETFGSFDLDHH